MSPQVRYNKDIIIVFHLPPLVLVPLDFIGATCDQLAALSSLKHHSFPSPCPYTCPFPPFLQHPPPPLPSPCNSLALTLISLSLQAASDFIKSNSSVLIIDVQDSVADVIPGTHHISLGTLPFKACAGSGETGLHLHI